MNSTLKIRLRFALEVVTVQISVAEPRRVHLAPLNCGTNGTCVLSQQLAPAPGGIDLEPGPREFRSVPLWFGRWFRCTLLISGSSSAGPALWPSGGGDLTMWLAHDTIPCN